MYAFLKDNYSRDTNPNAEWADWPSFVSKEQYDRMSNRQQSFYQICED